MLLWCVELAELREVLSLLKYRRERSGSLTCDRGAAGLCLTGVTALCP